MTMENKDDDDYDYLFKGKANIGLLYDYLFIVVLYYYDYLIKGKANVVLYYYDYLF